MEDQSTMNWKCYDCNMNFSNPSQLQKHKSRFCVGGMGDPDQLMLRKGFKSEVPKQRNDDPPVEDEPVSFDLHADPKVKQLAENHGRSMEAIQNRNRDLERQREEIRRRLEDLGRRPVKDEGMNDLLAELKEQEARNRQLLEDLRRQISNQHSVQPPAPVRHNNFAFPVYYGNSLTAEIAATRQGYLGNGGSDPDVLQQLAQMQAEAQAIDDNLKNQRPAPRQRDNKQSEHLLTLELENERLQRQLLLIQEQNLQSTHRRKGEREGRRLRELGAPREPGEPRGARATTSHAAPGPVPPLDVGFRNQQHYDIKALHTEWAPLPNPMKEKIDKELQNKFGYNRVIKRRKTVERSYTGVDGFRSFLPDNHEDEDLDEMFREGGDKDIPYYRIHMTGNKLNRIEEGLRKDFERTGRGNVRSDDTEFRLYQRSKSETPVRPYDVRTQFEDEFFLDNARSEVDIQKLHKNRGHARPQLFIEAGLEKEGDW